MFNWNSHPMGGQRFPMPRQPMMPFAPHMTQMPPMPAGSEMPFQQPGPWIPNQGAPMPPPMGIMMNQPWPTQPQALFPPVPGNVMPPLQPMVPLHPPVEEKPPLPAEPPPPLPNAEDKPPLPPVEPPEHSPKKTHPKPPPDPALLADLKRIEEEEKIFMDQYKDWKKQYDDWREQNESHPNKDQYQQYLEQWKTYEKQMEARKETILSEKDNILKKLQTAFDDLPSHDTSSHKQSVQGQAFSSLVKDKRPNSSNQDEGEKGEEDMNIDEEESDVGGIIESGDNVQPSRSWQASDNQLKGDPVRDSDNIPKGPLELWDFSATEQVPGSTNSLASGQDDQKSQWNNSGQPNSNFPDQFHQGGPPNRNFDSTDPIQDVDEFQKGFDHSGHGRGRGADRGFFSNRGGRGGFGGDRGGGFERGRGGFGRGRGGRGGFDAEGGDSFDGDEENYEDISGLGGRFGRGRGGFESGRGGSESNRAGFVGRGGRGGFEGGRGGFEGGRGGFEGGRGGFEGGRGGFEGGRGGFDGGSRGFEGGRGGFEGGRGGFEGGRGGFDGGRGGFEGGKGGFEGGRGGLEGGRGGFESGRGGFEGGRGGFEGGRGGFEGGRGGFEGGRGGFEGGRGGFDGGRGGFEVGRGGFDGGRGGFEGVSGSFDGGRGGFEGGRGGFDGGRGGFDRGRGGFDRGRGIFEGFDGDYDGRSEGTESEAGNFEGGRGGFQRGSGGLDRGRGGRGRFEGGQGGFEGERGGFDDGGSGFDGGRGGFHGGRGSFDGGKRGGFDGGRGGFEGGRGGFEGGRGGRGAFEGGRGGRGAFDGGRGGRGAFDGGRGGRGAFDGGRGGRGAFDGGRGSFHGGRGGFEGGRDGFDGDGGNFESNRGGYEGARGGFDRGRGRGGYNRGRGSFDSSNYSSEDNWGGFEGSDTNFGEGRGRFQRGRGGPPQGPTRGRGRGGFPRIRGGFDGNRGVPGEEWYDHYGDQAEYDNSADDNYTGENYQRDNENNASFFEHPAGTRGGHFGQRGRRPSAQNDFESHSDFRDVSDNQGYDEEYKQSQRGRPRGGFQRGGGHRGSWHGNQDGSDQGFDSRESGSFEHGLGPRSQPDIQNSASEWSNLPRDDSDRGPRRDLTYQDEHSRGQGDEGPQLKRSRFDFDDTKRDSERLYPPPHPDDLRQPLDPYRMYPDPYARDPYFDLRDPFFPPPLPAYRYDPYDRYGDWSSRYDPLYDRRPPPDVPYADYDKSEKAPASTAQPAEVIDYGHGQSSKENADEPGSTRDEASERQPDHYMRDRERMQRERDSEPSSSSHQTRFYDHGHKRSGEAQETLDPWQSMPQSSHIPKQTSEEAKYPKSDFDRNRERPSSPNSYYMRERESREQTGIRDDSRSQHDRDLRESGYDIMNRGREFDLSRMDERHRDSILEDHHFDSREQESSRDRDSERDHGERFRLRRRSREREPEGGRRGKRSYDERNDRDYDGRFTRGPTDMIGYDRKGREASYSRDYDNRLHDRRPDDRRDDRGSYRREDARSSSGGRRDERDSQRLHDRYGQDRPDDHDAQSRDYERYRGEPDPSPRNEDRRARESDRWPGEIDFNDSSIPRRPERGTMDSRFPGSLKDPYAEGFSPDVRGTPPLIGKTPATSSAFKKNEIVKIEDLLCPPGRAVRPPHMVTIIRGLPGSGKTYVSKLLREKEISFGGHAPRMLCLDDYFMVEVDKTETDPETGKKVKKKVLEYEYEQDLEDAYRQSLLKSFKKTVDDGFFPFIIVDATNEKIAHFSEFWSYAKSKGFQVYVGELNADVSTCINRNIHRWTEWDIEKVKSNWEPLPNHYIKLDLRWLLQEDSIPEVVMEDTVDEEEKSEDKDEGDEEDTSDFGVIKKSKWELDTSEETLDKLDGIRVSKKHIEEHQSMDDYLQLDQMDDDYFTRESVPGKKRVRWADLEEKKNQNRRRDLGFIVGQTQRDWDRITDDDFAEKALNQTKYFFK